ncbi:MAG: 2-oxoacid:acceptor oxidoreductase family protein [Rhodospirillales bacterium]|nr:2-oxoacid:acceptor oxidoreductase family protein [Rhodospirillales bacterium]
MPRKMEAKAGAGIDPAEGLADPQPAPIIEAFSILLTGIGGTGVITSGALLGIAAHIDGLGVSVLDQTGIAQKNGAVMSHVRLSREPGDAAGTRIGVGGADLVIGFDMVVAAGAEAITAMDGERTRAVINDHLVPLATFTENPDMPINADGYADAIGTKLGGDNVEFINATWLATHLMGDAITSNIFLMGYAYQKGLLPISASSIIAAIQLNGVAAEENIRAFAWGRVAAADPQRIHQLTGEEEEPGGEEAADLDTFAAANAENLTRYQNRAYGQRYLGRIERLRNAEEIATPSREDLSLAAARNLYRLMAYKDEYEVARLFSDGAFRRKLEAQFSGAYQLRYHLAPPVLAATDPVSGAPRKREFGPWMGAAFHILAQFKYLRGTFIDPFGAHQDRRQERRIRDHFESLLDHITENLKPGNYEAALALVSNADQIRGFGHIKRAAILAAEADETQLAAAFNGAQLKPQLAAAE